MKKGFTLIELLAVIVILGIVLVIAVPTVIDVVNNSRLSAHIKNEEMLVETTKLYLTNNKSKIPLQVGETSEVSLTNLQNENLAGEIIDPRNKNNICNGYVLITKIDNNIYDYTPHLNCVDNTMGSAAADGLLLHYKFDDFQEYTENFILDPLNIFWSGWANTENHWGVTREQVFSDFDNDGKMVKYIITAGTTSSGSHLQIYSGNNSIVEGKTYGLSFYAKAKVGRRLHGNMIKNGTPWTSYVSGGLIINITNKWERHEWTFTANHTASDARIQLSTGYDQWDDEIYIYKPQLEERSSTPFVDGIREGVIRDYSGNNNYAILDNYTPRWIEDPTLNKGVYQFVGDKNQRITTLNNVIIPEQYTLIQWIKGDINNQRNHNIYTLGWDEKIAFRNASGGTTPLTGILIRNAADTSNQAVQTSINHLNNEWRLLVVTVDRTVSPIPVKIYLDGKLESSSSVSNHFSGSRRVQIASWTNTYGNITGSLSDSRIYSRVLSEEEIRHIYIVDKHKGY